MSKEFSKRTLHEISAQHLQIPLTEVSGNTKVPNEKIQLIVEDFVQETLGFSLGPLSWTEPMTLEQIFDRIFLAHAISALLSIDEH